MNDMVTNKRATLTILLFLVGICFSGCGKKTAQLQNKAVPPDKTLYENAVKNLEKSQYIKARLTLNLLINTYPDSDYTPRAFYEVANTYYKEGGTESLMQAETQYRDFQLFYPTSELASEAQFKIAALNMRLMLEPERDSTHSQKAEAELKKFIEKYPDHELTPIAKLYLKDVQQNEAQTVYKIAQFYHDRKFYKASAGRYKQVADNFPDFASIDEVYYKLGEALEQTEKTEDAVSYYNKLVSEFPKSSYLQDAKNRLTALNRPIPEINQALAAQHEQINPDTGFSPLQPLKDFMAAMGLSSQGDPYERAQNILKQDKERREALAAAQKTPADIKAAETGTDEKDIIISTTISKTADGQTQDNTTVRDPRKQDGNSKTNEKKEEKNKKPSGR